MLSARLLSRTALVVGALALALPAAAGTLSGQLRDLANSYQKAPGTTVTRLAKATTPAARQTRLFAPHVSADGAVQVYLHYRPGEAPPRAALDLLGARGVLVSRPLGLVQAWVPIAKIHAAAALAGVSRVTVPTYARVKLPYGQQVAPRACSAVPTGLVIDNEGLAAENVGPVHDQGIKGEGVKIGIISNGAECLSASRSAGYLPSNIYIPSGMTGSGSEGTAMLEEAYAMAPQAALGFCGVNTTADFLRCFNELADWGADVISDDLGFIPVSYNYTNFPAVGGGDAIAEFADAHPAISLTTSAGNDGYDFYQANYKANTNPGSPGGPPISLDPTYTTGGPLAQYEAKNRSYGSAMDFGAAVGQASDAALTVTIAPGAEIYGDLTWNDPVHGPYDDLDLFLLDQSGDVACQPKSDDSQWCSSTLDQMTYAGDPSVALPPFEFLEYTNDSGSNQTLYLVALCYDCSAHGTNPLHIKLYGLANGGAIFNYVTYGGVNGHSTLAEEFTIAAAQYNGSGVSSTIENYSDTGPFTYGDWTGAPQTRAKPDVTGTDCTTVSGAGGFGSPFCGTSAASPNVGAVVALLRGFAPSAEPDAAHWKRLVMGNANPNALTNYSKNAGGAGLVDAAAAAASVTPDNPPKASDGTLTTKENHSASGTLQASDPDGDPLTFSIASQSAHGKVTISDASQGSYTYTPEHGYSGSDSFTFKANDGTLNSNTAKVSITVQKVPSGGGGGAFGGLGLGLLAGLSGLLLLWRRKH